jgi:hypothetical protein
MRSIVRRDTGEGYEEFLRRLAQETTKPNTRWTWRRERWWR